MTTVSLSLLSTAVKAAASVGASLASGAAGTVCVGVDDDDAGSNDGDPAATEVVEADDEPPVEQWRMATEAVACAATRSSLALAPTMQKEPDPEPAIAIAAAAAAAAERQRPLTGTLPMVVAVASAARR
jgi:hypothetical protein